MRILVLAEDSSFALGLSRPPFNHQLTHVRSVAEVEASGPAYYDAVVIDLGTTRRGLVGASDLMRAGLLAPCLVLGDEDAIDLAIELAPDASVLVPPFSMEELDYRLLELLRVNSPQGPAPARRGPTSRSAPRAVQGPASPSPRQGEEVSGFARGPGQGWVPPTRTSEQLWPARMGEDVSSGVHEAGADPEYVRDRVAASDPAADPSPVSAEQYTAPREPAPRPAPPTPPPPPRPRTPKIWSRLRGELPALEGPSPSLQASDLLGAVRELDAMLNDLPHLLDRAGAADQLLTEVVGRLRPDRAGVWVPASEGYELVAARGMEPDVARYAPFDQTLFLSFETNLDAILVTSLDPTRRPATGIPGVQGETMIGSALRMGDALEAVVLACRDDRGYDYDEQDRDVLHTLAVRMSPLFSVAGLVERLRARRYLSMPSAEQHLSHQP